MSEKPTTVVDDRGHDISSRNPPPFTEDAFQKFISTRAVMICEESLSPKISYRLLNSFPVMNRCDFPSAVSPRLMKPEALTRLIREAVENLCSDHFKALNLNEIERFVCGN